MQRSKISELNIQDRPREKALTQGTSGLTDTEVVAILLRCGGKGVSVLELAHQILQSYGSLQNLCTADINQLIRTKDIGQTKAITLKTCYELALRLQNINRSDNIKVSNPNDLFLFIKKELYDKQKEHLYLICLNSKNITTSKVLISMGTINETLVDPREIFKTALEKNSVSIALAHNHPSGDITPSIQDISMTEKLAKVGNEIGIPLIDHLVVNKDKFTSMKALNLMKSYKFD